MRGGLELRQHGWVHSNHQLFLLRHLGVAFLLLLCDPISEGLAYDSGTHVDDPLLGDLLQVWIIRQVVVDVVVVADELHDPLHREVLVLGQEHGLNVGVEDLPFLLAHEVFEKIDRGVV